MLTIIPILTDSEHIHAARALYERAFPENERRDFDDMLHDASGICDLATVLNDGRFCGFACTLVCLNIAHIIYFAVEEKLRGKGIGSSILHHLHDRYAPMRVIVDIERCGILYPDNAQRTARKAFYQRAGYTENPVFYRWQDEDYEVLSFSGGITYQEFCDFWHEAYTKNPNIG